MSLYKVAIICISKWPPTSREHDPDVLIEIRAFVRALLGHNTNIGAIMAHTLGWEPPAPPVTWGVYDLHRKDWAGEFWTLIKEGRLDDL